MVRVLVSSVVYREYEPWSGPSKDYKISTCCFSVKHEAIRSKSKNWLPQIMFPNGTTWFTRRLFFQWAGTRQIQLSVFVKY